MNEDDKERKKQINYLSLFKIDDQRYIIGIFQEGITVFKQQIRALNIFYALMKTGVIKTKNEDFHIGVFGAGIAGMTFTAAALKAGLKVTLIEKEAKYLHMQYGCDIRKIHPNLYDFPDNGSLFPYAKVPVLSWKYDSASNVTKQIVSNFKTISDKYQDETFSIIFNAKKSVIRPKSREKIDVDIFYLDKTVKLEDTKQSHGFDLIIYATGFGTEIGVTKTPSYWRNDDFGQPILSATKETKKNGDYIPKKFFISGVGDGALIDLFRLKISGFSFDALYQKCLKHNSQFTKLRAKLSAIKKEWKTRIEAREDSDFIYNSDWLHQKFIDINKDLYRFIFIDYLFDKIVDDVAITLNGKIKYEFIFNLKRISMLNAFLLFIFEEYKLFDYKQGEVKIIKGVYCFRNKEIQGTVLIRHGTDRRGLLKETFKDIGYDDKKIDVLEERQRNNYWLDNAPIWSFKEMNSLFNNDKEIHSFYTSETVSIFSNFTSILSRLLTDFYKNKKRFRLTIHRLVAEGNDGTGEEGIAAYQQITPYYSNDKELGPTHDIGRTFELDQGIVGLSIKTGNSYLLRNVDQGAYDSSNETLKINYNYIKRGLNSCLSLPIVGIFKNKIATNLVLFIDSTESDFFDQIGVLNLIEVSVQGFIDSINQLIQDKHIHMSELEFVPSICSYSDAENELLNNPSFINLSTQGFESFKMSQLRFSTFYSFDVVYRQILEY